MDLLFEHQNFFHPSIIPYRGKLMMIMHKILAMDNFSIPYYCFSDDGGKSWSEPQKITPLEKFAKCADFRPLTLADDSKAGIIGIVKGEKTYKSVYLFYDGTWSEAEYLPNQDFADDRAAGTQTAVADDNSIIIPFFCLNEEKKFVTVCRKYRIDGKKLVHLGTGNPLTVNTGRGLYEPSVAEYKGKFYLTMRCDENCAWVSVSNDGLHWELPKKWYFLNGKLLTTSPTQQHWMKLNDELYLVYTRQDETNEDCFRWRTPLFAAPVDINKMCLDETKETIILPRIDYRERPGLYGNFNVTNSENRVYISDAPLWFDWTADKESIAWFSSSVYLKRLCSE